MKQPPLVLIIDDDPEIRRGLASALSAAYGVHLACSGEEGIQKAETLKPDLVLLDLVLPGLGGVAVLRALKKKNAESLVIIMSAYGRASTVVQAIKLGAADFLEKPLDPARLLDQLNEILTSRLPRPAPIRERIIGESRAMRKAWRLVERFGPTEIPILLEGESGTGKDLFAQAIHQISKRAHGPLVTLDCGTIPEELAESELFGYEAGAFTGATKSKVGKVAWADGGTLFIDEIGVLSLSCQAKLLRLIEQQTFTPLGAREGRPQSLKVRFISATNVPLRDAIARGAFREDLYHRVNGFAIELPPLREREGDLDPLIGHFLEQFRQQFHRPDLEISCEALDLLRSHLWPGNVRELQRVLAAAAVMADRIISPEHLPSCVAAPVHGATEGLLKLALQLNPDLTGGVDLKRIKELAGRAAEREVIVTMQRRTNLNRQELARLLGVDPKTLRSRLREALEEKHEKER
ncbi:MAG: sigma-54 dependent transcriptional regulator [Acidobacteriota bacterium]